MPEQLARPPSLSAKLETDASSECPPSVRSTSLRSAWSLLVECPTLTTTRSPLGRQGVIAGLACDLRAAGGTGRQATTGGRFDPSSLPRPTWPPCRLKQLSAGLHSRGCMCFESIIICRKPFFCSVGFERRVADVSTLCISLLRPVLIRAFGIY